MSKVRAQSFAISIDGYGAGPSQDLQNPLGVNGPGQDLPGSGDTNGVPAAVKIVVYPGALHAFDVPDLPPKMKYGFATIGYQPEAAASARREVEQFLRARR